MCLGDSITNISKIPGSYRKYLYNNLIAKGYNIKMVGDKDNNIKKYYNSKTKENFEYQDDNTGYSGYTIKAFGTRKGLLETLKKNQCLKIFKPDIILLLIGTNNVMENYDLNKSTKDFITLINYIFDNIKSNFFLFIGTIPDLNPNTKICFNWFKNYRYYKCKNNTKIKYEDSEVKKKVNNNVKNFNKKITKVVDNFRKRNYNIRIDNLNKVIKNIDKYLFDGVHPNEIGFKLMGNFWTRIIENYLNGSNYN